MINEFRYGQTRKIWPSRLSLSLYNPIKQIISLKFFKGCLLQNLLSPLLNTLSQLCYEEQVEDKTA